MPPNVIDPLCFPGLTETILSYCEAEALAALRATSREVRDLCDSVLARHLVVIPFQLTTTLIVAARSGHWIPGAEGNSPIDSLPHSIVVSDITQPFPGVLTRLLGHVQYLDLVGDAETSIKSLFTPFLRNLKVLRVFPNHQLFVHKRPSVVSFTAPTVVLDAVLHTVIDGGEPRLGIKMSEVPSGAKTLLFRSYVGSGHDADTLSPPPRYPKTVEDIHIYLFTKVDTQESISDTHSRIKALIAGLVDVTSTTTSYHFVLEKRSKNWNTHAERSIMAAFRKISAAPVRVTRSVKGHRDSLLSQYLNDRWAFNDIDGNGWKIVADPVTTKHLARLEAAFLVRGSVPAWEGVIPLAQDHLFLKLNSRVACFSLPLSEDFVTFLNGADVPPSQAGAGATYVVPSSDFGLSTDLIVRGNIASQICKMANLHRCTELTFKTWKMVVQPAGQTAKVDVDLPATEGDNHLGTLTVCLPSDFTGGKMKVSQKAPQADSDWTTWAEFDCAGKDDTISWVFVPSGCTQQLEPVKTGTRVDIIFEVFTTSNHPIPQKPMGLLNELKTALNDPLILPNGGILAFGLQGAYPDIPEDPSHRLSTLQGEDRVWAGVLTEAGIPHEVVAVYAHPDRTNDDEYARRSAKLYAGRVPMVSRDFFLNYCKSKAERQPESMYSGDDIVWVTMPAAYSLDNFLHNSEDGAVVDKVGLGLFAYIGPHGDRLNPTLDVAKEFLSPEDDKDSVDGLPEVLDKSLVISVGR